MSELRRSMRRNIGQPCVEAKIAGSESSCTAKEIKREIVCDLSLVWIVGHACVDLHICADQPNVKKALIFLKSTIHFVFQLICKFGHIREIHPSQCPKE
jgi:hypothetical protein